MKSLTKLFLVAILLLPLCLNAAEEKQEAVQPAMKSIAKEGETYSLRYTFKAGESQVIISDATIASKNQIGEMSTPMAMQVQTTINLKIASIDEVGSAQIDLSIDSIEGEIEMMGQKHKMPTQMTGNRDGSFTLSELGEMVGGDAVSPAMLGPSAQGVASMAANYFIVLPIKDVKVGESWMLEEDVPVPGSEQTLKLTMKNTLEDIVELDGEKVAVLSSKMEKIGKDIQIDAKALLPQGMPLPAQAAMIKLSEFNQIQDASAHFSLDRGCITWIHDNSEMLTDMGGMGGLMGGMNQNIRTEMKTESVMHLKDSAKNE